MKWKQQVMLCLAALLCLLSARAQRARIPQASDARSAGTARRRQGLKPVRGETRAAGLDAQRESPARSEAEGDAPAASQESATSACATATSACAASER